MIIIEFSIIGLFVLLIGALMDIKEFVTLGIIMVVIISPLLQLILPKEMLEEEI